MKHDKLGSPRIIPNRVDYDEKTRQCPSCREELENSILFRKHVSKMHPQMKG